MTTDGAANEHGAAVRLVNEGNELWCADHQGQLVQGDCLDPKKAKPPLICKAARDVVQKTHDLVTHINGHKDTFTLFSTLAKDKKATDAGIRNFDALVIDNDTRWDSKLSLLDRAVYFDAELIELQARLADRLPREALLSRLEFDLAFGMTHLLLPFRIFTKVLREPIDCYPCSFAS